KRYAACETRKNRKKCNAEPRLAAVGDEIVATSGQRIVIWMSVLAILELAHCPAGVVADSGIPVALSQVGQGREGLSSIRAALHQGNNRFAANFGGRILECAE